MRSRRGISQPVYFKKVVRGINTMLTYVGTTKGRVYSRIDGSGKEEWLYEKEGANPRPCVKDPTKECTFCGLCFTIRSRRTRMSAGIWSPLTKTPRPSASIKIALRS
jgi:hypothetical protein